MSDRLSKPVIVLFAVVLATLGAVVFLFLRAERRMARIEEQLARSSAAAAAPRQVERAAAPLIGWSRAPTAGAEPEQAEAPPARRARKLDLVHAPAQPKMPEARKFAEENELDELQWRTVTKLNAYWMETVKKASSQGEDSLTDPLDYVAKQRDIKLRATLGSDDGVASYKEFEGSLEDDRITFKAKDGTVYGAAPFE